MLAVALTAEWVADDAPVHGRGPPDGAIAAACMTRYEAIAICGALIGLAAIALLRRGTAPDSSRPGLCEGSPLYPAIALILFTLNSRWTTGTWFVPFRVLRPRNKALGNASLAFEQVRESLYQLSGTAWVWPAYAFAVLLALEFLRTRTRAPLLLILSLAAAAALPWSASYNGHPLRVQYGLPLILACAATTGVGVGLLWAPLRPVAAALIVWWALSQSAPLNLQAPLVAESQRDAANMSEREAVTEYLRQHWDRTTNHDQHGLPRPLHARPFAAEHRYSRLSAGRQRAALGSRGDAGTRGFVTWVVIEERAEGGDALHQAAARDPKFLDGFDRVAEGGGVALYRAR